METCCWILFIWEATPIFYVLCCSIIMCAFYLKLYYPFTILVSLYWTLKEFYFSRTPNCKILKHTSKWCAIQIGVQIDPMTPHVIHIAMVAFFTVLNAIDGTYEEKLYIYGYCKPVEILIDLIKVNPIFWRLFTGNTTAKNLSIDINMSV